MPKLKDIDKVRYPRILGYGPPGSGKTAFFLTGGESVQLIDIDDGALTGLTLDDKHKDQRLNVDVILCNENDANTAVGFNRVKTTLMDIATKCRQKKYPYRCLVLDSLTTLAESAMRYVLKNSNMLGKNPQIQHWGIAFNEIENLLMYMRTLPIATVCIGHQMIYTIDDVATVDLAVPGQKLPSKIMSWFDEVWYFKVKNAAQGKQQFTVRTKSTNAITARSRANIQNDMDITEMSFKTLLKEKFNYDLDAK